jgi:hypothetical protein
VLLELCNESLGVVQTTVRRVQAGRFMLATGNFSLHGGLVQLTELATDVGRVALTGDLGGINTPCVAAKMGESPRVSDVCIWSVGGWWAYWRPAEVEQYTRVCRLGVFHRPSTCRSEM